MMGFQKSGLKRFTQRYGAGISTLHGDFVNFQKRRHEVFFNQARRLPV